MQRLKSRDANAIHFWRSATVHQSALNSSLWSLRVAS
jgi:hypothetical protein